MRRFQPETLSRIVNSDQRPTPIIHQPLIPIVGRRVTITPLQVQTNPPKVSKNPFRIFLNVDVDILLGVTSLSCAVFYGVLASISSLFVKHYPYLSEIDVGLCFLGIGGGMAVGSGVMGRILDHEYQHFKKQQMKLSSNSHSEMPHSTNDFPIERVSIFCF